VDVDVVGGNCVEDEGVTHVAFVDVNVEACVLFDDGAEWVLPTKVVDGSPGG
jgi:hypothetical protein